jgi:hypothetical protein
MNKMTSLLYVTTFNKKLFDATGRDMVASFLQKQIEGHLLVCYEDDIEEQIPSSNNILTYSLEKDSFLNNWLSKNSDVIPKDLGGDFLGCSCDGKEQYLGGCVKGCAGLSWNRRASLWFRKVVALNKALSLAEETQKYSHIVFIDSDVIFTDKLHEDSVKSFFGNYGCLYHLGKRRKEILTGIETGVTAYSRANQGFVLLKTYIECFDSGKFREYDRWDDSYVLKKVIEDRQDLPSKDLVEELYHTTVIPAGDFGKYLFHDKGAHAKKHKIFPEQSKKHHKNAKRRNRSVNSQ